MIRCRICAFLAFPLLAMAGSDAPVIPLWPNGAPGSEGLTSKEVVEEVRPGDHRVSNIHNPSLTVYLPAKDKATGAAIIVIPGGGHRFLTIENEGYNVAAWLSNAGIAGFVLKHRLAHAEGSTYKVEVHSLQDTQRAIRLVRSRATEWGLDPARVGVLGFSAGGELAALASTRYDNGLADSADPIERQPSRPGFQVLLYPGIPRDMNITKDTPPAFLGCAYDDRPSISEGLATLYLALKKAGVPAELHIYNRGGHGFGIRNRPMPVSSWPMRLQEWMDDRGLLRKQ